MLTDVLDLFGLLLLVAAVVVLVWMLAGPAAGLGVAGAGVLAVSWVVDRRGAR